MANDVVQLPADGAGKKLDAESLTVGANTVYRERIQISGAAATEIAPVTAADGITVNLGTNNDVSLNAGTNNIGDVDVLTLPALVAGTANIGDVDVLTVPAPLSTTGTGTEATALRVTVATDSTGVLSVDDNGGSLTVDGTVAVTGVSTLAEQQTQTTHLATIAGDTTDIETAVELIDDTVAVLGTTTYTEASSKGLVVAAVRRDADTTLVDTTNEVSPLQVDANGRLKVEAFSGETLPVSGTVTANLAAGTNNIGDVDVLTLPALVAGTANIGDVDVLTVPAPLSTTGTGTEATALRVTVATDSTGVLSVDDNGGSLTVDGTVTANLAAGTNNIGDVDVLTLPALVAGTANIGDVDIASAPTGSSSISVQGTAAHAAAAVGNPVYIGGRASTAVPTDVGADADVAALWVNRNGLAVVSAIPGAGLNADPYTLLSVGAQYTTTQTSAVLLAGGASERIIVTAIQIQVGGTTAGTLQVYFGTGAFARGTNSAIFDGEFAPSATLKPGFNSHPPSGYRSPTLGHDVLVTTSAAINPLTITVWYYLLGV